MSNLKSQMRLRPLRSLAYGGLSSVGRASDCGSECRGEAKTKNIIRCNSISYDGFLTKMARNCPENSFEKLKDNLTQKR